MLSSYLFCLIAILEPFVQSSPLLPIRLQKIPREWFTITVESTDSTLHGLPVTYQVLDTMALKVTLKSLDILVLQLDNHMVFEKSTGKQGYIPQTDGKPSSNWLFWSQAPDTASTTPFFIDNNGYLIFEGKYSWFVCSNEKDESLAVKWGPAEYSGDEPCKNVWLKTNVTG